jgi:hypothetical protein
MVGLPDAEGSLRQEQNEHDCDDAGDEPKDFFWMRAGDSLIAHDYDPSVGDRYANQETQFMCRDEIGGETLCGVTS